MSNVRISKTVWQHNIELFDMKQLPLIIREERGVIPIKQYKDLLYVECIVHLQITPVRTRSATKYTCGTIGCHCTERGEYSMVITFLCRLFLPLENTFLLARNISSATLTANEHRHLTPPR